METEFISNIAFRSIFEFEVKSSALDGVSFRKTPNFGAECFGLNVL
ncbi:hypothetical protein NDA07_19805 [Microcoleus vaginatus DQ-U2]|nr:hypothetical protein [Microcoleus sp. FACHB-DQ6]